jgi:sodium/potassium-transporting ATPase subunit alpha
MAHPQRVGDKTPADLILFAATEIKVDNSSLTGEAEPQERHPVPDGSKHRPVEAENVVCCSTVHQSVTALLGPGQR